MKTCWRDALEEWLLSSLGYRGPADFETVFLS